MITTKGSTSERVYVPTMDFALTDEQELIRRTAREFTDREVIPAAKENSRNHHFDTDLVRKIADQGYLGAIIPREYGGAGVGRRAHGGARGGEGGGGSGLGPPRV